MSASAEVHTLNGAGGGKTRGADKAAAVEELRAHIASLPMYSEKRGPEEAFARKWIRHVMKICPYEREIQVAFMDVGYEFVESFPTITTEEFAQLIIREIADFKRSLTVPKASAPENSEEAIVLDAVEAINKTHFQSVISGRAAVFRESYDTVVGRKVYEEMSLPAFDANFENKFLEYTDKYLNRKVRKTLAKIWREHPLKRQYEGIGFDPSEKMPPNYFNSWQGLSIAPKKGEWTETRKFIFNVICGGNAEHYEYLIRWCARMVQFPGEPAGTCIVLKGKRGTGKGTFASILRSFLGEHSLPIQSRDQLVGRFNGHLETTVCLIVDESFYSGHKTDENTMKALITEPVLTFEDKGRRAKAGRNCLHIVMLTNDDWAVPAGEDERRYFVIKVSEARAQDTEYFGALRRGLENGEAAAMLHDLLEMDLSDFDVFRIPKSDELVDQKIRTLRKEARWLHACLESGMIGLIEWADRSFEISKKAMWEAYVEEERKRGERYPIAFSPWAKKVAEILGNCIREGKRKVLKASEREGAEKVLRPRNYELAGLTEARDAFAKWLKSPEIEWDLSTWSTQRDEIEQGRPINVESIFD